MIIYRDKDLEELFSTRGIRAHQWDYAEHDQRHRYVDFKEHPELIEETLIDFHPWRHFVEIGEFYDLIRWLNGPESVLETNDCAFHGPHPNDRRDHPRKDLDLPWRADGRVMVLWRELRLNRSRHSTDWLGGAIQHYAKFTDQEWTEGVLGLAFADIRLDGITPNTVGRQISIQWWLWEETEARVMAGFGRLSRNLREVLGHVSREVNEYRDRTVTTEPF
jgi:hypothetical protein